MAQMSIRKFVVGACVVWPVMAWAETSPAEQAAQMLARVQSVDAHCNYLNASDKDELSKLVARAELALAGRESVQATSATMQRGHTEGAAAACSDNEKEALNMILAAARDAAGKVAVDTKVSSAEPQPDPAVVPAVPAPVTPALPVQLKRKPTARPKMPAFVPKPREIRAPKTPSGNLGEYARLTQAYFKARRCGGQDPHQISQLYQNIVALHGQLMQSHTNHEVANVLQGAQARALSVHCS